MSQLLVDGNKVIAEFMGESHIEFHGMLCRCDEDGSPWDNDPISWLDYEQNWNELMPVIEKIEEIGFRVSIERGAGTIRYCKIKQRGKIVGECDTFSNKSKIEATWLCVIKFIKYDKKLKIND